MNFSDLILEMFYSGRISKEKANDLLADEIGRLELKLESLKIKMKTIDGENEITTK